MKRTRISVLTRIALLALPLVTTLAVSQQSQNKIQLGSHQILVAKNRYGKENFSSIFELTDKNSAAFLPGKTQGRMNCGKDGAQFYIRHDSLPFAKPAGHSDYYVVRTLPYGTGEAALSEEQCQRLSKVWSENMPIQIPLLFLSDHWKYDPNQQNLVTESANNLFVAIESLKTALAK